ncbi:MAG: hypothetical protein MUD13_10985 [Candidatus Nanopelagicales bacterium]|nr:hypothetical protein [Candidatus Nanopelagicales bacterium]
MRRLVAALVALVCVLGFSTAPTSPAAADTASVEESGWSVQLDFPDMQWSSWKCQFLPVSAVVSGAAVESWTFGGFVDPRDSEDEYGFAWFIDYDDMTRAGTGSFTFRHAVLLCPWSDSSGAYDVVGEVGVQLAGSTAWTWQPYVATFTVSGIPTETILDPIEVFAGEATFTGRSAPTEPVPAPFSGCRGEVEVEAHVGDDAWDWVDSVSPDADGSFAVTVPTWRLGGATQFRARRTEWVCAGSTSAARALPVRLPIVWLSSNSSDSKLKVDIDPNRGRRSWTFQVQRERDDGSWRKVGTYRTIGKRETRTINLPRGCYRVRVRAQAGFAETFSDSWCLAR